MKLVPVHCPTCVRSYLIRSAEALGGAVCIECGAAMRALPGQTYGSDDVALFGELERTLRDAQLSPLNAVKLAVELEASGRPPGQALKRVARLLPSLAILELVDHNLAALRKAEGMVATLLDVIASSRSQSEVFPSRVVRSARSGRGLG